MSSARIVTLFGPGNLGWRGGGCRGTTLLIHPRIAAHDLQTIHRVSSMVPSELHL